MTTTGIIKRPIITEHSLNAVKKGIFTFEVGKTSTKSAIERAVESLYSVHVTGISTSVRKGKVKHAGKKRRKIERPDRKIARVHLKKGEKIAAFELKGA